MKGWPSSYRNTKELPELVTVCQGNILVLHVVSKNLQRVLKKVFVLIFSKLNLAFHQINWGYLFKFFEK